MQEYSFHDEHEHRYMLDRLDDMLPLRNFGEMDATPTTAVSSLPTPKADDVILPPFQQTEIAGQEQQQTVGLFDVPPGAPLLKDLDSFTEGTAKEGSFEFSLAEDEEEEEEQEPEPKPVIEITPTSLQRLYDSSSIYGKIESIQMWRFRVHEESLPSSPTPGPPPLLEHHESQPGVKAKRPHSVVEEELQRRIKPHPRPMRLSMVTPFPVAKAMMGLMRSASLPSRPCSAPPSHAAPD